MPLIHVVDDDSRALRSISEALAHAGYSVFAHRGVASYLDVAVERRPDLIVADVLGAQADAVEYLAALRARNDLQAAPIVIMSALNVRGGVKVDELLKDRFGVAAIVRKPCPPQALFEVVRRALDPSVDPTVHQPSEMVASAIDQALSELDLAKTTLEREPKMALAQIPLRQIAAHPTSGSRGDHRLEASFEVLFSSHDAFVCEYTQNISRGGLFVRTQRPPKLHANVMLTLRLPGDQRPLEIMASVAHVSEPGAGAASGFGARLSQSGRREIARWQRLIEGVDRQTPARMRGPKVLLLGFSNERAAELARNAGLLCRQEVSLVPMQSWQSVLYEARRMEEKQKLLIIDVSFASSERRRELFDAGAMRELASISNTSLAFIGLLPSDELALPSEQHVIRAGALGVGDLVGAVVSWLDLPARHELRVPISGRADIECEGERCSGALLDVSAGGVRFLCKHHSHAGQTLLVSFALPESSAVHAFQAEVRWAKPEGRGMVMHGVQFSGPSEGPERAAVKHYIDQQALLLRSLEGLRREAVQGGVTEERVRKIVPLEDEPV